MATPKKGRRALGRGLDALLPSKKPDQTARYGHSSVFECPIERIAPRRDQPRQHFDDAALAELADTIATHGLIQPLVVRRISGRDGTDDRYEIIAGERRWRASQRAGLKSVAVVVKDVTPNEAFELALIENLQRQDLNPIEVAEAYQRLLEEHEHTQEQLADRMGKSRVAVTNALRLLKLPDSVRSLLVDGSLSEGHGRALLGAPTDAVAVSLARRAVKERLSVRQVEKLIRAAKAEKEAKAQKQPEKSAAVRDLEARFTRKLGTRVAVEHHGKGGKVVLSYSDLDELDRIIAIIGA